jgi:hypothetical protein
VGAPPTPAAVPLEDRLALRELVDAYAMAVDQRDETWFRSLWLPDARLTTHAGAGPAESDLDGIDAIARIPSMIARYPLTLHVVANHLCRLDGDGDGAGATGEAYCIGHHLTPTDDGRHDDYVMAIRYIDRYGRDDGGAWRFARREVRRQFTRTESVDGHPPGDTA